MSPTSGPGGSSTARSPRPRAVFRPDRTPTPEGPPLVCPSCAAEHPRTERFCRDCGLPLVLPDDSVQELSATRERARKVLPRYSEGPLVKVGSARNQAEAEMLENLLLEEGIPSLIRRSGGFALPYFLAAGPRDILVPASGSELARDILGTPDVAPSAPSGEGTPQWVKAMAVAMAVGIVALIAAGLYAAAVCADRKRTRLNSSAT